MMRVRWTCVFVPFPSCTVGKHVDRSKNRCCHNIPLQETTRYSRIGLKRLEPMDPLRILPQDSVPTEVNPALDPTDGETDSEPAVESDNNHRETPCDMITPGCTPMGVTDRKTTF